jgi:hypothetical protein
MPISAETSSSGRRGRRGSRRVICFAILNYFDAKQ